MARIHSIKIGMESKTQMFHFRNFQKINVKTLLLERHKLGWTNTALLILQTTRKTQKFTTKRSLLGFAFLGGGRNRKWQGFSPWAHEKEISCKKETCQTLKIAKFCNKNSLDDQTIAKRFCTLFWTGRMIFCNILIYTPASQLTGISKPLWDL